MKTKFVFLCLSCVFAMLCFASVSSPSQSDSMGFTLNKLAKLALADEDELDGGELPGVTITCDSGGRGTCYSETVTTKWMMNCLYVTIDCSASGDPKDSCEPGSSLICNPGF